MTDRTLDGLLTAICDDPSDDGARLVFADHLAERDRPGDGERADNRRG